MDLPRAKAGTVNTRTLRIDVGERRATVGGQPIALSPLLWRLLCLLADHPHRLVTRAELKQALWPYAVRIDTERRLNTAVRSLRAALGDDVGAPRYIKTERSYGYRWVGGNEAMGRRTMAPALALVSAGLMLVAMTTAWSARPQQPSNLGAVVRAQSAVEEWRGSPTARSLASAEGAVAQAGSPAAASPTLLVLKAELELGGRWNWRLADRDYRAALKLEPANADARLGLAWLAVNRGQRSAALRLAGQLLTDTVLTGERRTELGWLLIRAGRPDLATNACGINSGASINRLSCAHSALAALGRMNDARFVALQLMASLRAAPSQMAHIRALPANAGYAEFLHWRIANFLPARATWFQRAQIFADAGRRNEALDSLARSVAAHEPTAIKMASTPSFEMLSAEPRFRQLTHAIGLPPAAYS
ncbi:winged helix-turn-helix domain-containing protein [Sphingomonas sp.]|uniref:winged helix-turn-helix domain-containing protein n=1 Tax=Sphingomonas sp. TaxID=28214 RepID=UPI00286A40E6|nr:winged helix-turn-helix domain-containing protein [Sphingomonas sp.]